MNHPNPLILAIAKICTKAIKIFLVCVLILFSSRYSTAQNASVSYVSSIAQPAGAFTVCGNSQQNGIRISNGNAATMTNIIVTLHLPTGGSYVAGSVVNAVEINITDLSNPQFSVATLSSLNSINNLVVAK